MRLDFVFIGVVLLSIEQNTDALQARDNATVLYPAFILGIHLPLIFIFVVVVFLCRRAKRKRQVSPPPASTPPDRLKTPKLKGRDYTVPSYWTNQNPHDIEYIDITHEATEYMKTLIYSLWKEDEVGIGRDAKPIGDNVYIDINTVKRVQNVALYQKYLESKSMMERKGNYIDYFKELEDLRSEPVLTTEWVSQKQKLAESDLEKDIDHGINEHYLFHGTKNENVIDICRKGLSPKVGKGGLYGSGVYTAEHPNKSDQYTVPSYWTNQNPHDIEYIDITHEATEYMKTLIYSLWKEDEVGIGRDAKPIGDNVYIDINTVKRVQNVALYQKYLESKSMMERKGNYIDYFKELEDLRSEPVLTTEWVSQKQKLAESDLEKDIDHGINEHYLFHGTKNENVIDICRKGLSPKVGKGGLYGSGVYTAEHPNKSDQYTDHNIGENNTLLLCRVCLGEIYVQRDATSAKDLKSPPCRTCYKHGCRDKKHGSHTFDSVVADVKNFRFREYVVYRDYRVYPEYIIHYTRHSDDTEIKKYREDAE